jgi:MinD superfamily P-loop ATPase
MKIAVTGGKGGTGKSTVATALAVELAKRKSVLLVDADVECPNDHLILSARMRKDRDIFQLIPKWDFRRCTKCGECGKVCKQNAIVSVKGMRPAFVPEMCIGCQACIVACPVNAIGKGRKKIGTIYTGKSYGVDAVSGELKLGELSSGEIVAELRKRADQISGRLNPEFMLIDSAAGIGCPVIASINGTDFVVAVTEPTPSALHDLKRVLYIADHFSIPKGIVINKSDLEKGFCRRIEAFAKRNSIPVMGRIPYKQDFVDSTIRMEPIVVYKSEYQALFAGILDNIERVAGQSTGKALKRSH